MKKQSIAYFLLFTLLIQSCVAYKKTSITPDQAHDIGIKGRLIRHNGDTLIFYNIKLTDSVYYANMRERVKNSEGTYDWIESQAVVDESMVKSLNLDTPHLAVKIIGFTLLGVGAVFGTLIVITVLDYAGVF